MPEDRMIQPERHHRPETRRYNLHLPDPQPEPPLGTNWVPATLGEARLLWWGPSPEIFSEIPSLKHPSSLHLAGFPLPISSSR